ncbi:MAG: M23 family metallopeptidase [Chloroflexi bacterium]|nr:M23 family metallopeptidase [Chloroflexota bacterium]
MAARRTGRWVFPVLAAFFALSSFGLPAVDSHGEVGAAATDTPGTAVLAGLALDGLPAHPSVSTTQVYQGGAVRISVAAAATGSVTMLGRTAALLDGGQGTLVAILGVGTEDAVGPTPLRVDIVDRWGEAARFDVAVEVLQTQWTVDYIVLPPGVGGGLTAEIIQAEEDRLRAIYSGVTAVRWEGIWVAPVDLGLFPISGYFGEQRSFNGGPVSGHHGGTDIGSRAAGPSIEGAAVAATNAGVVVLAEEMAVRGNMVIVDHGGGVFSGYAHLQQLAVVAGQPVGKGQVLGHAGTTGLSTGPHLHWELAAGGVLVDGLRWLDGTQGF